MTLPTMEVVILDASGPLSANPKLLEPALEQVRAGGLNVPLYYGLETENPNVGLIVVNWESYEQHLEITKAPFYAEVTKYLASVTMALSKIYHAQLSAPNVAGLDKPVTEIVIFTLKAPENRVAAVDVLSEMARATENMFVFGVTHEDENKYIGLCGWDSVEAHRQVTLKLESQGILGKLRSLADKDMMYHVELKEFL